MGEQTTERDRLRGTGGNRFIPADATRADLLGSISDQLGDLHAGGWYRQEPKYREPEPRWITRWVGIRFRARKGPNVTFYRKRSLGFGPGDVVQ